MSYTWAEPFAGAAACALRLVGGRDLLPPVAWMGGKRRYARAIADAMGVPAGPPERVLLADAGPWGWVWPLLVAEGPAQLVAGVLRSWQGRHPRDLWAELAALPPARFPSHRAAQWLWLQARSASGVPIWWDGWRHVAGTGRQATDRGEDLRWPGHRAQHAAWLASDGRGQPRPAGARAVGGRWEKGTPDGREPQDATNGQRGTWRFDARPGDAAADRQAAQATWRMERTSGGPSQAACQKGQARGRTGGMVNPATIAERIEAIAAAFAGVEVVVRHGDARGLLRLPGFAYLDPPYVGATGYGWDCPRAEVVRLARAWADVGAVVAVSEAEPLPLEGWHHVELTRPGGKPEWLTLSRAPVHVPERQAALFSEEQGGHVAPRGSPSGPRPPR